MNYISRVQPCSGVLQFWQQCIPILTKILSVLLQTVCNRFFNCRNASSFCNEDSLIGDFSVNFVDRCILKSKLENSRHLIKLGEHNPECRSPANVLAAVLTPSVYSMQSWPRLSPGQPFCCIADVYSLAPGVGVSQGIALQAGVALNEEFFKWRVITKIFALHGHHKTGLSTGRTKSVLLLLLKCIDFIPDKNVLSRLLRCPRVWSLRQKTSQFVESTKQCDKNCSAPVLRLLICLVQTYFSI